MTELRLTAAQRQWLQAALKAPPTAGYARRAAALLALDAGQSVGAVAAVLGVSRQSVYNWARAFARSPRPEALADDFGGGRPRLWTPAAQALLAACLGRRPEEFGYAGQNWTVPLLRQCLGDRLGLRLSDDTVRRRLQGLGYTWKRFRYVLPPDPQREKKKCPPPAAAGLAAAGREAGGGRDRPAAVPAPARRLGVARPTRAGADQRGQRQAGLVRGD